MISSIIFWLIIGFVCGLFINIRVNQEVWGRIMITKNDWELILSFTILGIISILPSIAYIFIANPSPIDESNLIENEIIWKWGDD